MTDTDTRDRAVLANVPVIDAHHHLWQLGRFPYRWLSPSAAPARFGDKSAIRHDYLPPDYRADMSAWRLVGSVHVQANCGAPDPVEETRWLQGLSDETGWPTAAIAEVDLTKPDARGLIDRHATFPILRGIRTPVAWDRDGRWRMAPRAGVLSEPGFRGAAGHLAARGLVLEMVVAPEQLPEVADFAADQPRLTIVINHFATLEPRREDSAREWFDGLATLSEYPNVFLKLSGLWTADKDWTPEVIKPFVASALDSLGSGRLMYGSNLPVEGVNCPASRQIEQLAHILANRDETEIGDIFNRTAAKVYRIAG